MKLKELTVMLTKKVSENYDSKGVTVGQTITLEEGDDKDIEYAALVSWCAEKIAGTLKAHGALPSQPVLANTPDAKPAPKKTASSLTNTAGEKTFVVETLSVEVKGGKRYTKAKGGIFTRYGVNVWPEVLAMPPLEWNADELDGADYPAPTGLTAIYIEKAIEKDGEQKMVPDKVTGWA